ncbi:MAG: PKD domain-containing protein [Peptococcaceae bacterium]
MRKKRMQSRSKRTIFLLLVVVMLWGFQGPPAAATAGNPAEINGLNITWYTAHRNTTSGNMSKLFDFTDMFEGHEGMTDHDRDEAASRHALATFDKSVIFREPGVFQGVDGKFRMNDPVWDDIWYEEWVWAELTGYIKFPLGWTDFLYKMDAENRMILELNGHTMIDQWDNDTLRNRLTNTPEDINFRMKPGMDQYKKIRIVLGRNKTEPDEEEPFGLYRYANTISDYIPFEMSSFFTELPAAELKPYLTLDDENNTIRLDGKIDYSDYQYGLAELVEIQDILTGEVRSTEYQMVRGFRDFTGPAQQVGDVAGILIIKNKRFDVDITQGHGPETLLAGEFTAVPAVPPSGLQITGRTFSQNTLEWQPASDPRGINEYEIYRRTIAQKKDGIMITLPVGQEQPPELVGRTKTTAYTDYPDKDAEINYFNWAVYEYSVRAVDKNGNPSEESNRVRTDAVPLTSPPAAPQGLYLVTPAPYENHLRWTASADDTGISKYLILRRTLSPAPQNTDGGLIINLSGNDPQIIGTSFKTEYKDTHVEMGAEYQYTVMAIDTEQNPSEQSAPLAVLVPTALTLPRESTVLNEGETYRATGTFDPPEGAWRGTADYGDGSGLQKLTLDAGNTFALAHTYWDDGGYNVKVRFVRRGVGEISGTIPVKVNNVAPVLTQLGTNDRLSVGEGETLRLAGAFSDPGTDRWTLSADYGDSPLGPLTVPVNSDKTFTLEHQYYQRILSPADSAAEDAGAVGKGTGPATELSPQKNSYLLRVQITDDDGPAATKDITVGVTNVPPVVAAGPDENILRGIPFTREGSFSDPGQDSWQAFVDYGDGSGEEPLLVNEDKTFRLAHIYLTGGTYTVAVRVKDQDGGQGTASFMVKVKDYLLTPNAGEDMTLLEGENLDRKVSIGGPPDKIRKITVDYGDGSEEQTLYLNSQRGGGGILRGGASTAQDAVAQSYALTHSYADDGVYAVTLQVTDVDGDVYEDTFRAEVQNAAPVVSLDKVGRIKRRESFTLTGSFRDPGADQWTVTVDFDDGGGEEPLALNAGKTFSIEHSYTSAGHYTVTVTVKDDEGGEGQESLGIAVVMPKKKSGSAAAPSTKLSSLLISDDSLSPAFDPNEYDYMVWNVVTPTFTITPTAAYAGATITIAWNAAEDGSQVLGSGGESQPIPLDYGDGNRILIDITADGVAPSQYTVYPVYR